MRQKHGVPEQRSILGVLPPRYLLTGWYQAIIDKSQNVVRLAEVHFFLTAYRSGQCVEVRHAKRRSGFADNTDAGQTVVISGIVT